MINEFWNSISKKLAGEWIARMFTPALVFWGIGLILYVDRMGGWSYYQNQVTTVESQGVAWITIALFILVISIGLVNWLTLPVLKLMEGYWPWVFAKLRFSRSTKIQKDLEDKRKLVTKIINQSDPLKGPELEKLAILENELLLSYPNDPNLLLPTRLGNILRSGEEYPLRYGLEITTSLPRLWLLLPESAQKELSEARQILDNRVQLFFWGFLLLGWIFMAADWTRVLFVIVSALFVMWASYRFAIDAASGYTQLLRSVYDLYRFEIYRQLGWPLPHKPSDEKEDGEKLTKHLYRFYNPTRDFVFPEKRP